MAQEIILSVLNAAICGSDDDAKLIHWLHGRLYSKLWRDANVVQRIEDAIDQWHQPDAEQHRDGVVCWLILQLRAIDEATYSRLTLQQVRDAMSSSVIDERKRGGSGNVGAPRIAALLTLDAALPNTRDPDGDPQPDEDKLERFITRFRNAASRFSWKTVVRAFAR